jgi:hypothetical protein
LFDVRFAVVHDARIVDVGFNIAVGLDESVLLYASDGDNIDSSVSSSLVSLASLGFWLSSCRLSDVP